MVEEHEDDIMEWYTHKQHTDPIEFLCAERIIDSKEQGNTYALDWLYESLPMNSTNVFLANKFDFCNLLKWMVSFSNLRNNLIRLLMEIFFHFL